MKEARFNNDTKVKTQSYHFLSLVEPWNWCLSIETRNAVHDRHSPVQELVHHTQGKSARHYGLWGVPSSKIRVYDSFGQQVPIAVVTNQIPPTVATGSIAPAIWPGYIVGSFFGGFFSGFGRRSTPAINVENHGQKDGELNVEGWRVEFTCTYGQYLV